MRLKVRYVMCLPIFFVVTFRRVYGLESYSRTSGESNRHRKSVSTTRVMPYQLHHEDDFRGHNSVSKIKPV